jgi:hypothetical protein
MQKIITSMTMGSREGNILSVSENGTSAKIGIFEREFHGKSKSEYGISFCKVTMNEEIVPKGCKTEIDGVLFGDYEWIAKSLVEGVPFETELKKSWVSQNGEKIRLYKEPDGYYKIEDINSEGIKTDRKIKSFERASRDIEELMDFPGSSFREVKLRKPKENSLAMVI